VIEVRTFRKPRHIGKNSALAAFAMVAAVGAGTAISAATPASAATDYSVNATQACSDTYTVSNYHYFNIYAGYTSSSNPYSWVCTEDFIDESAPATGLRFVQVGAPDFQTYCSIAYPGSQAVLVSYNVNGWRCQL
jgi:hypothetical protein